MHQMLALEVLPESALRGMVDAMVRLIEAGGAVVIMIGAVVATIVVSLFTKPKTPEELKGIVYERGTKAANTETSNG